MAAITAAVVVGGAAAYSANRQASAAKDASRAQAEGVGNAQQQTIQATNRARDALTGFVPENPFRTQLLGEQSQLQGQLGRLTSQRDSLPSDGSISPPIGAPSQAEIAEMIRAGGGSQGGTRGPTGGPSQFGTLDQQISGLQNQLGGIEQGLANTPAAQQHADPRGELLGGIQSQMDLTGQGFTQAGQTLSPVAEMAQPFLDEQFNLLGLGGDAARQEAFGRVADPLQAEQERAFMRNNAQFGGVGGNALSALAEQTRSRTEANIGNRLGQLSSASAPSLNALQQLSGLQQGRGQALGGIAGQGGQNLAAQETARRQAMANLELGQGSELAQLAQNMGAANASRGIYGSQNAPALAQGITAGIGAWGGGFGGGGDPFGTGSSGYGFGRNQDPFS